MLLTSSIVFNFPNIIKPLSPDQAASVRPLQTTPFGNEEKRSLNFKMPNNEKLIKATAKMSVSSPLDKHKVTRIETNKLTFKSPNEDGGESFKSTASGYSRNTNFNENSFLKNVKSQPQQIEYVSLETLMFGANPPPINPETLILQNHDSTK